MEVKNELTRIQKNTLRSVLLGVPSSSHHGHSSNSNPLLSSTSAGGGGDPSGLPLSLSPSPYLPIHNLEEINPAEGWRVPDSEIEVLRKRRNSDIFADGEENLKDLQAGLLEGVQVPVPDVEEISAERYDQLYPAKYGPLQNGPENRPFIRSTAPPPVLDDSDESSDSEEYDLDEEDDAFLIRTRKENPNFVVTDCVFESVIAHFLHHGDSGSSLDQQPSTPTTASKVRTPPRNPYPLCLLSRSNQDIILAYFHKKNDPTKRLSSIPAWQPNHDPSKTFKIPAAPVKTPPRACRTTSSPKIAPPLSTSTLVPPPKKKKHFVPPPPPNPYKIFRRPIPKTEPKILRSHKNAVSFGVASQLSKKALQVKGIHQRLRGVMQFEFLKGLQQRRQIVEKMGELYQQVNMAVEDNSTADEDVSLSLMTSINSSCSSGGANSSVLVVDAVGNKLSPGSESELFKKVKIGTDDVVFLSKTENNENQKPHCSKNSPKPSPNSITPPCKVVLDRISKSTATPTNSPFRLRNTASLCTPPNATPSSSSPASSTGPPRRKSLRKSETLRSTYEDYSDIPVMSPPDFSSMIVIPELSSIQDSPMNEYEAGLPSQETSFEFDFLDLDLDTNMNLMTVNDPLGIDDMNNSSINADHSYCYNPHLQIPLPTPTMQEIKEMFMEMVARSSEDTAMD